MAKPDLRDTVRTDPSGSCARMSRDWLFRLLLPGELRINNQIPSKVLNVIMVLLYYTHV